MHLVCLQSLGDEPWAVKAGRSLNVVAFNAQTGDDACPRSQGKLISDTD